MKNCRTVIWGLFLAATCTITALATETPYQLQWVIQPGTNSWDASNSVATDNSGNIYIAGATWGDLGGPKVGDEDAFLAKYDASGALLWIRQRGTSEYDEGTCVAIDDFGNAYICGRTYGSLAGTSKGKSDAFLIKYDSSGTVLWEQQLGTTSWERAFAVAVDCLGNAYITGSTQGDLGAPNEGSQDAFIAKYNSYGAILWTRQLGTSENEDSYAIAVDSSCNVYITGRTGDLIDEDAFLVKYDTSGTLLWAEILRTDSLDISRSVAVDSLGNVYISGRTTGNLGCEHEGFQDPFLAKYDPSGTLLWIRQPVISDDDWCFSVAIDNADNIYISGFKNDGLGTSHNGDDAFIAKYDSSGTLLWTQELRTDTCDQSYSVAVDDFNNVYISGITNGDLTGSNTGGDFDVFIAKFSPAGQAIPEPGTIALLIPALAGFAGIAARKLRK